MVSGDLYTGILGITVSYIELTEQYFQNLTIGDAVSIRKQRELLRALYIYLQVLNYYYLGDSKGSLKEEDINFLLSESMRMINLFKTSYYE